MAIYKLTNAKFRDRLKSYTSKDYIIYDDDTDEKLTLAIRQGEVAVSCDKKTWRVDLMEAVDLMYILDGHFETVRDGIIQYYEAHRAEVSK